MATHSSVLAWRIPGMGEPGGLPSMGSHRVGHEWSNLAAAAAAVLGNRMVTNFPSYLFLEGRGCGTGPVGSYLVPQPGIEPAPPAV